MTDDTIASPGLDGAVAPSAVTSEATAPAVSGDASAARDSGSADGIVLVEEISIDGMCGVY